MNQKREHRRQIHQALNHDKILFGGKSPPSAAAILNEHSGLVFRGLWVNRRKTPIEVKKILTPLPLRPINSVFRREIPAEVWLLPFVGKVHEDIEGVDLKFPGVRKAKSQAGDFSLREKKKKINVAKFLPSQ